MNAAYAAGLAVPLGHIVSWIVRYDDAWWVLYERGWLRVTDAAAADDLDRRNIQMTEADAATARDAAICVAVTSKAQPPAPS
jgi:hypothetical protein